MVRIIAEISANHNQSYTNALKLVSAAKLAGADAVKVQIFTPEEMAYNSNGHMAGPPWNCKLFDLYERAVTPSGWVESLRDLCLEMEMDFIASVYSPKSYAIAKQHGVKILKIASFEVCYAELLKLCADDEVIMSTGAATEDEIWAAASIIGDLTLLHCACAYPPEFDEVNLSTVADLRKFGCPVGFSDHTKGSLAAMMATALGASVIEKHICLDRECLDGNFSLTPVQFMTFVRDIRFAEIVMGTPKYEPKGYRRAQVAIEKIKKGENVKDKVKLLRTTGGRLNVEIADRDYEPGQCLM